MNKISESLKEDICNYYLESPKSIGMVADYFGLSTVTISKILKERKCKIYTRQELFNEGTNESFFEKIQTEEQAYFLGLFISDGCIFKTKLNNYRITLSLQEQDSYMIERFKELLHINRSIVKDKRDNSSSITLSSNKMAVDLAKYGVVPNKTFKTYLPILPSYLMPHLLRGIIDGDGNIGYRKRVNDKDLNANNIRFQVSICGSELIINQIKEYLVNQLGVFSSKVSLEGNIYSIRWTSRKDFFSICNYIYSDATIYLKRKRDRFIFLTKLISS